MLIALISIVDYFLVLNDMVEEMGDFLKTKHNIEEYAHVALPTQVNMKLCKVLCSKIHTEIPEVNFVTLSEALRTQRSPEIVLGCFFLRGLSYLHTLNGMFWVPVVSRGR